MLVQLCVLAGCTCRVPEIRSCLKPSVADAGLLQGSDLLPVLGNMYSRAQGAAAECVRDLPPKLASFECWLAFA